MKWLRLLTCVGFLSLGTLQSAAPADYPTPSPFPVSWELDWRHQKLQRIVVTLPGEAAPRVYWYLPFGVTNNSGEDRAFLPTIEMVTREGQVIRSNQERSARVFEAIQQRESKLPLQSLERVIGTLLQGEDQSKYSVAIWEQPLADMGSFSIYVAGLSGEMATATDGEGKPLKDAAGRPIVLRKTKQIDFTVRGDDRFGGDPVVQNAETWVMR